MLIRIIAALEGFSTLAIQMIALRQAIPVVGSSIVLTSIYIGVILLSLSVGYWVGGRVADRHKDSPPLLAGILSIYLVISGLWYGLITFGMHTQLLEYTLKVTESYIITLFVVSVILFVVPVFLASQTLPLLTQLVPIGSKGNAAGSMLFVSTIGSFLGSVGTATVLFPWLGVQITGAITVSIVLLAGVCSIFLWKKSGGWWALGVWMCIIAGLVLSVQASDSPTIIRAGDTPYHTIEIRDHTYIGENVRLMVTNGGFSSAWNPQKQRSPFPYVRQLVQETQRLQPATVLLIGTAGFTYPAELDNYEWLERMDAIDIDGEFLDIAQNYLLEETLSEKVVFHEDSARYFLNQAISRGDTYDLIVLDAYNGRFVPAELATVEFFEELKQVCNSECKVMSNLIVDKNLESNFAQGVVGAMWSVFGELRVMQLHYGDHRIGNSIITTYKATEAYIPFVPSNKKSLPTDDRNDLESELIEMRN